MATVEKRPNRSSTSYRIIVSCGYDKNGKQIRKKKTFTLPHSLTEKQREKEIEKQKVLFEQEVQNGTYLDGDKITFSEYARTWMESYAEKELAPSTVVRYKALLTRINQAMGEKKLCRIQPIHINSFISNLSENDIRIDHKYIP